MLRFSANITLLFRELPITKRFGAARNAGFDAVEILTPEDATAPELQEAALKAGVEVVLCNAPMGDFLQGGAGLSAVPGRQAEFQLAIRQAAELAQSLACSTVHIGPSRVPPNAGLQDCNRVYLENLLFAVRYLSDCGITATIEPLNSVEMPDIFLSRVDQALAIMESCGSDSPKLQFDVYHVGLMEENFMRLLESHLADIGHIQIADIPGRGEPGTGTLNFANLFDWLSASAYPGWVGAEYRPSTTTTESLEWFVPFRTMPV